MVQYLGRVSVSGTIPGYRPVQNKDCRINFNLLIYVFIYTVGETFEYE